MAKKKEVAPIFLSASIPDPKRHPKYINSADNVAIREAVTALTLVGCAKTKLVFGGHPAISPLVYLAAKSIKKEKNIVIYQSKHFEKMIPKESLAFSRLMWTPDSGQRDSSLLKMRTTMMKSECFGFGVFIGGMEGVEEECLAFFYPDF